MQLFKLYICITLIFVAGFISASADNTYPFSYKNLEFHDGGELIVSGPDTVESNFLSFLIKPKWADQSDVLSFWHGIKRQSTKGNSLGGANIIASYPLESSLLIAWAEADSIFISRIDSNNQSESIARVSGQWNSPLFSKAEWIGRTSTDEYLILVNQYLYLCNINRKGAVLRPIASNILTAIPVGNPNNPNRPYHFAYLLNIDGNGIVYFVNKDGVEKYSARVSLSDEVYLYPIDGQIAVVSSSRTFANTLVQIIGSEGVVSEIWVESKGNRIKVKGEKFDKYLFYLKNTGSGYSLMINRYKQQAGASEKSATDLPKDFIEPMGLWLSGDLVIAVFRNGLVSFDQDGSLISSDYFPFGEYFAELPQVTLKGSYLIMSSKTGSIVLEQKQHAIWFFNRFIKNSGKIVIPFILSLILIVIWRYYINQKRLLRALLNLPSSGVVFVIDGSGRLVRSNASGKKLLGITDSVPMRKLFQYYCVLDHTKPIREVIEKSLVMRDSITQKINIMQNNDAKEWFCTIIPLTNLTGRFQGLVFTGIDITEELERKRLSNWAQLAHDMQTNLSTIRLNAEQLDEEENPKNMERRKKIIMQVNLLIQRVRDIVTVGRSDSLDRQIVDAADIVNEARMEFDEAVFPNVEFLVEAQHFNVSCDKPKMIRALRNSVENAVKSLQGRPGIIKISNWNDFRFTYFAVQDNGVGMDEKTRAKFLTPYFTTAKKQGGSGIGTMIMQHVMELHGGTIEANSEKGKGTEIVFVMPNFVQHRTPKTIAEKFSARKEGVSE